MSTIDVVLVRHGESEWNKDNRFCGWVDVALSDRGIEEANNAVELLKKSGYLAFDKVYEKRLNERHYGNLTGLNKVEMVKLHGIEKVMEWRRSYDSPPPPITEDNPYYHEIGNNE